MSNLTDLESVDSKNSKSLTHTEHVPLLPQSDRGILPIDTQPPVSEVTKKRVRDDPSYRGLNSNLKKEGKESRHGLRVLTQFCKLSRKPLAPNYDQSLSMTQALPMKSGQFQGLNGTELVQNEDQERQSFIRRSQSSNIRPRPERRRFYKNHSWPACCKSKIYPRHYKQPSTTSSSVMANDNNWSQILDEYISQRCHGKNVNLSTTAESTMCWPPPPSYANVTVDFNTPLMSDPNSDNNHNTDNESEASSSSGGFEIESPIPDEYVEHPGSCDLPKMPGTHPRSPQEHRPGNELMLCSSELGATESPPQSQLCKDVSSTDAPKSLSNNNINMDDVDYAQSKGHFSPPRRPKYVYKPRDYSVRPREPWEFPDPFPMTPLHGVTANNRPDASHRLFSTARVQNDTADDFRARRLRRRHMIDEDDYSDEDWDAQGEPRKILRLHYQEVKKNGNEWEPLTDEKARELMLKGRVDKYESVKLSDTTGIEVRKRKNLETYKRRKLEEEIPPSSSSEQCSEPHNDSRVKESIESKTILKFRPLTSKSKLSRGPRVRVNGKLISHEEKLEREEFSHRVVVELRHLQLASLAIMEDLGKNRSSDDDETVIMQKKRELQEIRDKAVSMEIPATEDDRQRAARLISDIIDSNMRAVANGFGPDDMLNSSRWFSHDRFMNYGRLITALETEMDQLEDQMCILPISSEEYKNLESRFNSLQEKYEYLEKREDFYVDEIHDLEKWCDDFENHNPPLIAGDPRVNAEYGAAIGKWNPQASPQTPEDEEEDLQKAIRMSLGETEQVEPTVEDTKCKLKEVKPRLVLTMGGDKEGLAAQKRPPFYRRTKLAEGMSSHAHWKDSASLAKFQDDSMDENAVLEKIKAISRAQYRNESPPPFDDDY
ncbi:hypothetical protein EAE96_004407 [Botrytis aclada]|nr:hypothetical protein EAE96_004407 [Botrytis aclada]